MAAATSTAALGPTVMSEGEILRQIHTVKDYALHHKEELPNHIYNAMDGLSRTLLSYFHAMKTGHTKGWATEILNAAGESIWTPEQAAILEEAAPVALSAQAGGALNPLKFGAESQLVVPLGEIPPISIDAMYEDVKQKLATLDEKNREIASIIGPVAIINDMKEDIKVGPFPPYLPIPLQVSPRVILPLLNAFLETCRLLVSNPYIDIKFLRSLYSLILGTFDILRGNWRDGVLSFLGLLGQYPMMIGIVLKSMRWVYAFISPDIQARLEDDMFAASKSMLVGGWLWLFSVVAPDFVRTSFNELIETAKMPLEELNKKIEAIEEKTQEVASQAGVQVLFPKLPVDKIPSFDDIQNLQSLLSNPEIYCSVQFQSVLASVLTIPPLRLALELLNVPTLPDKIKERCKDMPSDIGDAIVESMKPIVLPLPKEQTGGFQMTRRRRQTRLKERKRYSHTAKRHS